MTILQLLADALLEVQRSGVAHNDPTKMCTLCHRFQDGRDYPPGHGEGGVAGPGWYDAGWLKERVETPPACVIATRALD